MPKHLTSKGAIEGWEKCLRNAIDPAPILDALRITINEGILLVADKPPGQVRCEDALFHLSGCSANGYSAAHIDPPTYGSGGYVRQYWWLDWFVGDTVVGNKDNVFTKNESLEFLTKCVVAAKDIPIIAVTQQEVAFTSKDALEVLNNLGRDCQMYEVPVANTVKPFYMIIGLG